MLIISILAAMIVLGIILFRLDVSDSIEFGAIGLCVFGTVGLLIALLALPLNQLEIKSGIKQFQSVHETVTAARSQGGEKAAFEIAAIQQKIVESNQWLASQKYWNGTVFDIWIPDEIKTLEPIR